MSNRLSHALANAAIVAGTNLYGFCGGFFGRDSYGDKVVEAIGPDWIVVREDDGTATFAYLSEKDQPPTQDDLIKWQNEPP